MFFKCKAGELKVCKIHYVKLTLAYGLKLYSVEIFIYIKIPNFKVDEENKIGCFHSPSSVIT